METRAGAEEWIVSPFGCNDHCEPVSLNDKPRVRTYNPITMRNRRYIVIRSSCRNEYTDVYAPLLLTGAG
jgi:hypothetical protein